MESKQIAPETKTFELKVVVITEMSVEEKDIAAHIILHLEAPETNILVVPYRQSADLEKRATAIGFAEWKDDNYINYQMREGLYYHKRDLLKHIDEATVLTFDQLYDLYLLSLTTVK